MSIKAVITTDSLRLPLTGIGSCTASLLAEFLQSGEFADLRGIDSGGVSSSAELQARLAGLQESAGRENCSALPRRLAGFSPHAASLARRLRLWRSGRQLRRLTDHILHAPDFIPPPFAGRTVITIHDLSHLRHPETHPRERVRWLREKLPAALAGADRIICVSEFTRGELLELGLVADDGKLRVCRNGVDAGFRPRTEADVAPALARWNLKHRGYILSVGTLEPRKNTARLIDAYTALPPELAQRFPLVLAGAAGWKTGNLEARIADLKPPYRIIVTGYLSRTALQMLTAGAAMFAYCSLYEGFGLPPLEAMASGTPVLVSNAGALTEVTGEAGYAVDALDTVQIASGIAALLDDRGLARTLAERGLQRAANFTWRKCAADTIEVYRELA